MRIGRIAYLNVAPYFHFLQDKGFSGEIISGVPAELNAMLADGFIDACPSSSYEYALNADDYYLMPGHSISSVGPVHSVLLFSRVPLADLTGAEIAITGESATSINLLKILLKEFCAVSDVSFTVPRGEVEECLERGQSALLIGDRALTAAINVTDDCHIIDLGALWYHFTGLPFVFALWILRCDAVKKCPDEIVQLASQLKEARAQAFAQLPEMAEELSATTPFSSQMLKDYWRGMSYDLTDGHLEGLKMYFYLCHKHGLLEKIPDFRFFPEI